MVATGLSFVILIIMLFLGLGALALLGLLIAPLLFAGKSNRGRLSPSEERILQDIHAGMKRLETRVESIETVTEHLRSRKRD